MYSDFDKYMLFGNTYFLAIRKEKDVKHLIKFIQCVISVGVLQILPLPFANMKFMCRDLQQSTSLNVLCCTAMITDDCQGSCSNQPR